MVLMLLACLSAAFTGFAVAGSPPTLAWPLAGIPVTATDSFKWVVRATPDGAGGAVVAWEENRGRRVCCRDTRDIYAQRLDAGGRRLWADEDVKVAVEEPGEELLGLAPGGRGGALLYWRRGRGTLVAQELDGEGKPLDGPGGTVLRNADAPCEWPQLTGFAVTPRGRRCMLVWTEGEWPRPTTVMGVVASAVDGRWLVTPPRVVLTRPGVHAAAVVACGEERWCLVWWSRTEAGITVGGQALGADGASVGRAFTLGTDPGLQYGHAEAAAAGPDRVFVIWAAVHPEHTEHTHTLHAASVTFRPGASPKVAGIVLGQARSQVMFIPSTVVQVGAGEEVAATPPVVAWRQTSTVAAFGSVADPGSGLVAWLDGNGLQAAGLRIARGRLEATPVVELGAGVNAGFSPLLAPAGGGRLLAVWASQAGGVVRAAGRLVGMAGGRLEAAGAPLVLAEGGTQIPRVACAVESVPGVILAWNALGGGDHGAVVAQRVLTGAASVPRKPAAP